MTSWLNRRTLIAAGASLLLPARVAGASPLDPRAVALVDAVNFRDVERWAVRNVSSAGLIRRSVPVWSEWLGATAKASGRWRLVATSSDSRRIEATIATARYGLRRIDLLIDRRAPTLLFDVRPTLSPLSYPGALPVANDKAALVRTLRHRMMFAVHEGFSGTILVADPAGQPCFRFHHGIADVAHGTPITGDTRFNLGSGDKSFTAVMIAQLVETGRLRFDMPVSEVLPALATTSLGRPTIEQLLSHSGGLGEPQRGILAYSRERYDRVGDLLPALAAVPPAFLPGTSIAYSNEGYVLLGAVIEAITDRDWWSVLADRIYRPAGMRRSGHLRRRELAGQAAIGYYKAPADLLQIAPPVANHGFAPWRGNACGGGYTTAADAIAWMRALHTGSLISTTMRDQLLAFTGYPHPGMAYGMGFVRREIAGRLWAGHSGGGMHVGIGSAMALDVEYGWAVAVLTNRDVPMAEAVLLETLPLMPRKWLAKGA